MKLPQSVLLAAMILASAFTGAYTLERSRLDGRDRLMIASQTNLTKSHSDLLKAVQDIYPDLSEEHQKRLDVVLRP